MTTDQTSNPGVTGDSPAVGEPVMHADGRLGYVTSAAFADWVFVKFLGYLAPRMCRIDKLVKL